MFITGEEKKSTFSSSDSVILRLLTISATTTKQVIKKNIATFFLFSQFLKREIRNKALIQMSDIKKISESKKSSNGKFRINFNQDYT